MKQRWKQVVSKILVICLVITMLPVTAAKAADTDVIQIITQPVSEVTKDYGTDYGTISVEATAVTGSAISYQWYYKIKNSSDVVMVPGATATESVLTIPSSLHPQIYNFYCELSADGCATVTSSSTEVTINKLDTGMIPSDTVEVKSNKAKQYQYVLPKLPERVNTDPGSMYYDEKNITVSGSGLVAAEVIVASIGNDDFIIAFNVAEQSTGTSDTITIPIHGGQNYKDSLFTLTVSAVDRISVNLTGITGVDRIYSGKSWKGFSGRPTCAPYTGGLNYHYSGRGDTSYDSFEAPVNAGDYTLTVSIPDGEDYTGSDSVDFSITPKEIRVYSPNYNRGRGIEIPLPEDIYVNYVGFIGADSGTNCIAVKAVAKCDATDNEQPGVYTIDFQTMAQLNTTRGANYILKHENATYTIGQYYGGYSIIDINLPNAIIIDNSYETKITATVDNSVSSIVLDVDVSKAASWTLYSDSNLTMEITDKVVNLETGDNTVYIKVTAQDTKKNYYDVIITRQSAAPTPGNTGGGIPSADSYRVIVNNTDSWKTVTKELQESTSGQLNITMQGTTVLPKEVLEGLEGKNITVAFNLGNGISWVLKGSNVEDNETKEPDRLKDIDLQAELGTNQIPKEAIKALADKTGADDTGELQQLSLSHEGDFGFHAQLTLNVGNNMAGRTANLYYYNTDTKELEYVYAAMVNKNGNVTFGFDHASDYAIAMDQGELVHAELLKASVEAEEKVVYIGGDTGKTTALKISLPDAIGALSEEDSLNPVITYTSSNPKVASVDMEGKIKAKKQGKAIITVTIKAGEASVDLKSVITVKQAYITLVKEKKSFNQGESFTYKALGYGVTTNKITFRTSMRSILVINKKSGKATARSKGTDYMTAEYGNVRKVIKVIVK